MIWCFRLLILISITFILVNSNSIYHQEEEGDDGGEDGHGSRVGRAAAIVEVLGGFGDKGKINGVPITPIIGGALGIAFGLAITAGIFASYHYISHNYYGPYYMTLEFYPEADNIVYGKGTDDVDTYSPRTLRMDLIKHYQVETENSQENLGHKVIIQAKMDS
ncbi:unnamed protein product [Rotaria sordida]|uniref:Uncharacterized protein n=1 Tax=Rotaria sordida TaxID=392033 RepID=A0A814FA11_9BILA|nr:unnamed protein product [Rotaria sordida]